MLDLKSHSLNITRFASLRLCVVLALVLSLSLIFLLAFNVRDRVDHVIGSHSDNFFYWMKVGDTFQMQRALETISGEDAISKIQVTTFDKLIIADSQPKRPKQQSGFFSFGLKKSYPISKNGETVGFAAVHSEVPLWPFLAATLLALLVFVAIRYHTLRIAEQISEAISNPVKSYSSKITSIKSVDEFTNFKPPATDIEEMYNLGAVVERLGHKLAELANQEKENIKARTAFEISRQVAHDIRSPLMALDALRKTVEFKSAGNVELLSGIISRISNIADDLLYNQKAQKFVYTPKPRISAETSSSDAWTSVREIESEIHELIGYKHAETNGKLEIKLLNLDAIPERKIRGCRGRLARIFSNLINNSFESRSEDRPIRVVIEALEETDHLILCFRDNGSGIPSNLLSSIGNEGFTTKSSGNGLGIWAAEAEIERFGGRLQIYSQQGSGTSVEIILLKPTLHSPNLVSTKA